MRVDTGPGKVEVTPVPSSCSTRGAKALLFNFDIDDATLKRQHQQWLDENVVPLLGPDSRIALNATASRSGSDQYNQQLSQRRLKTVKDYLLGKGALPSQITESAKGEQPAKQAGQKDGTEDARFRAVEVAVEARVAVVPVRVRVHFSDKTTHPVPSTLGPGGKDHFVKAKNKGPVTLQAVPAGPGISPADVTWDARDENGLIVPVLSPAVGGDPLTVRLASSVPAKIRVRLLVGGCVRWEGFVWIVYATISATPRANLLSSTATQLQIGQGFNFTHTILPASIISTTADVPDLTGANVSPLPDGTNHAGNSLQGGADHKWDNSRKIRKKFLNPANIPVASFSTQPSFHATFPNYPSAADGDGHPGGVGALDPDLVEVVGNDDAGTGDPEDNDPYNNPNRGKLTGTDRPKRTLPHSVGADGDTMEWRLHFLEFTRLEIQGKWYKISDDFPWRTHIRMRKAAGKWVDNGSLKALNNDDF
jgi:hypothetical protein